MLCDSLDGREIGGRMDTCISMAKSSLFTWNYYNIVDWLYTNTKCFGYMKKNRNEVFNPGEKNEGDLSDHLI